MYCWRYVVLLYVWIYYRNSVILPYSGSTVVVYISIYNCILSSAG